MKILRVGPCPCCGVNIWKFKMPPLLQWDMNGGHINWRPRPVAMLQDGTHFWVLQTDGSRMMIAICKDCANTLTDEKVKTVFADIIYTKLKSIKNNSPNEYKLFDKIRTTEVWKWFLTEKELVDYMRDKTQQGSDAKEHTPA